MTSHRAFKKSSAAFSLIELLVAMAIGLIVTLAVTSVLIRGEGSKRSTTSVNDINQGGAYATYVLDRAIRSAGSGFSQRWADAYGCLIGAAQGSTQVLPIPSTLPASSAFSAVTETDVDRKMPIRLAPVVIGKNLANTTGLSAQVRGDLLMVMAGTGGIGESPESVASVTDSTHLLLDTALGYRVNDLLLVSDASVPQGCLVRQAAAHDPNDVGQTLQLGGDYSTQDAANVTLTSFGSTSIAMQLGNASNNFPQFQMFGVGPNNTLESYDFLKPLVGTTPPDMPIADGVVELRAIYGLDGMDDTSVWDGTVDRWSDATGDYQAKNLLDGSPTALSRLHRIVAVRVGLIMRTALAEHSPTGTASGVMNAESYQAPATITLFNGIVDKTNASLAYTRTLTSDERSYRYRTIEVTIPLRNVILAP